MRLSHESGIMNEFDLMGTSHRRAFLQDMGLGFGSVALTAMLNHDVAAENRVPAEISRFAPKAKHVIWLFMIGGTSHLESFDPKPALNKYAGKTIAETPFADVLNSPYLENERVVAFDPNNGFVRKTCYPLQVGFQETRGKRAGDQRLVAAPQ